MFSAYIMHARAHAYAVAECDSHRPQGPVSLREGLPNMGAMRYAVVKPASTGSRAYIFSAELGMKDSEFLHNILCEWDPTTQNTISDISEGYSVRFTNTKPRETANQSFYFAHGAELGLADFRLSTPPPWEW